MSGDGKFSYDSMQDCNSITEYLEALQEGFEKGRIVLSSEGEEIILSPKDMLKFSVKAKKKGDSNKLSIKIEWKDMDNFSEDEEGLINISC